MQRYETAWHLGEAGVKGVCRNDEEEARVASKSQMLFKTVFVTGRIKFVTPVLCSHDPLTPFAARSS